MPRAPGLLVLSCWGLAFAGPLALALLLLFVAETARGHAFALVACAVALGPPLGVLGLLRRSPPLRRAGLAVTIGAVAGTLGLALAVPHATSRRAAGAWSEGETVHGLSTLLPEVDQLVLGSYLVGYVDPLITVHRSAHVRDVFLTTYRAMAADPDFAALPTQLGEAYEDGSLGQRFVYVPPHADGERLPCVVFLHGSMGSFQGYLWVWKRLADRGRFVVVAPGFGFGNWQKPGGVEAVLAARREAERTLPVDRERFILAGLSNGGRGVMRVLGRDAPGRWQAAVLLSAVVDVEPSETAWRDLPTLVVHGAKDDRISMQWVGLAAEQLRGAGARLELRVDPDEDHFLFFARPDEMERWLLPFLAPWLATSSPEPVGARPHDGVVPGLPRQPRVARGELLRPPRPRTAPTAAARRPWTLRLAAGARLPGRV